MGRDYKFWVYIVTNHNHPVLYIGVTNRLSRRTWQHREGSSGGFVATYQCKKLIYYEWYRDIRDAIARESQLKKWSRTKKAACLNPSWRDLGADVLGHVTSRDFSTPFEMTSTHGVAIHTYKLVTATRHCRSLVMVWMRS
jgi:putative endonuclease